MKRLLTVALLLVVLTVCEPALAVDLTGLYVAPKLQWSYQDNDRTKFATFYSNGTNSQHSISDKAMNAWGAALAVGYDFGKTFSWPIRAELEYAVREQSKTSHAPYQDWGGGYSSQYGVTRKMAISSLFANVFYDIKTGTSFTPYVGGGIGMASIRTKDSFTEGYDGYFGAYSFAGSGRRTVTNFAWNLAAGVAYSFDSNWSLDLGYRYCDYGQVKGAKAQGSTDGGSGGYQYRTKSDVTSHEVMLGARYTF